MPASAQYPESLNGLVNPNRKYKPEVLRAVGEFARSKPWRGTLDDRKVKFINLHRQLCSIYGCEFELLFGNSWGNAEVFSGGSSCDRARAQIYLCGRTSVVTYLHEFAHALGKDEAAAVEWSVNLFARKFPRSFAGCQARGHVLASPSTANAPMTTGNDGFEQLMQALGLATSSSDLISDAPAAAAAPARRRRRRAAECLDDLGTNC